MLGRNSSVRFAPCTGLEERKVEWLAIDGPTAAAWLVQLLLQTCQSYNDNLINLYLFHHLSIFSILA